MEETQLEHHGENHMKTWENHMKLIETQLEHHVENHMKTWEKSYETH